MPRTAVSPITFELAAPADDAALRRLLRENPIPGAIAVTFEREPDYFQAAGLEGPVHQVFVCREGESGEITAMGQRSVRPAYVNGEVRGVGYLSQLRIHPKYARGLWLARGLAKGFEYCRALHADGQAEFYLTSLIADNRAARRLVTAGLPGYPHFREYARLQTFAVALWRARRAPAWPNGLRLERGSRARLGEIVRCLQRSGARRQFAPAWTEATLCDPDHTPDLRPEDFFLALDGERVAGCLAAWDQGRFKQTVVRGYSGPLRRWRRLINLLAPLGGWPRLPPPDTPFRYCYASHLAVEDDDPDVFAALLRSVCDHAARARYDYVTLGLAEANPLAAVVRRIFSPLIYPSQLYLVAWDDGRDTIDRIDGRIPGPEVAVL